jgi:hypothetical protein
MIVSFLPITSHLQSCTLCFLSSLLVSLLYRWLKMTEHGERGPRSRGQ